MAVICCESSALVSGWPVDPTAIAVPNTPHGDKIDITYSIPARAVTYHVLSISLAPHIDSDGQGTVTVPLSEMYSIFG